MKRYSMIAIALVAIPLVTVGYTQSEEPSEQKVETHVEVRALAGDGKNVEVFSFTDLAGPKVNLDINNVAVPEALQRVVAGTRYQISIDNDVPRDVRVTLRANNVNFNTAMDLITEAAGVSWVRTFREGQWHVRVGATVRRNALNFATPLRLNSQDLPAPTADLLLRNLGSDFVPGEGAPMILRHRVTEDRATFTCPHCKGQSTIVTRGEQPNCPTCRRQFQPGWQFCPSDGAKRPVTGSDWRFCPLCGKGVRMKSEHITPSDELGEENILINVSQKS